MHPRKPRLQGHYAINVIEEVIAIASYKSESSKACYLPSKLNFKLGSILDPFRDLHERSQDFHQEGTIDPSNQCAR